MAHENEQLPYSKCCACNMQPAYDRRLHAYMLQSCFMNITLGFLQHVANMQVMLFNMTCSFYACKYCMQVAVKSCNMHVTCTTFRVGQAQSYSHSLNHLRLLTAVGSLHCQSGLPDPTLNNTMLQMARRGIKDLAALLSPHDYLSPQPYYLT